MFTVRMDSTRRSPSTWGRCRHPRSGLTVGSLDSPRAGIGSLLGVSSKGRAAGTYESWSRSGGLALIDGPTPNQGCRLREEQSAEH